MGPEGRGDEFGEALAELRRSGSALLVAGAVPDRLHGRTCDELLGTGTDERLFVRASTGPGSAIEPGITDRVLELDAASRGAATAGASASGPGDVASESRDGVVGVGPTLAAAGDAFEAELAALDTAAGQGPRVCVDSVLPLVETAGEEQAFRFLHLLTSRVRQLGGTCHLHLPLGADSETARTFAALVDATVELRLTDDRPEQRWHIHGADVRSDWLSLPGE
ncbi:DUF7504 family protein [Haloglomus litoreum]|uniref:DUF7504 family protein n=1 Tax=Haloglomus litoreum TaxID=3034026 RepID=UPI0023E81CC6|nr:hypothetical protein [Haloglomus sp. DT116]